MFRAYLMHIIPSAEVVIWTFWVKQPAMDVIIINPYQRKHISDDIIELQNRLGLTINQESAGYAIIKNSVQIRFVFSIEVRLPPIFGPLA